MNDDAERIARRMMAIRQDMGEGVQEIVHGAQHITDWRYYVRRHPWACVAGTLALGFLAAPAKRRTRDGALAAAEALGGSRIPATTPGLIVRAAQMAAPLVARSVATLIARRLAAGKGAPSHEAAATDSHE